MRVWIFDLDGTIIDTARFYGYAAVDFIRLMLDTFAWRSPSWIEIAEQIVVIDRQFAGRWGACRERFPGALLQCYRQLCERVGVAPDDNIGKRVWEIGESAFAQQNFTPTILIPGVKETLDFLKERGDLLFVVTRGDPLVQRWKWLGCGLFRWFPKDFFIVVKWLPAFGYPGDKTEVFAWLRGAYPGHEVYVVGDSLAGDIAPAIRLGMEAIYIPSRWRWGPGNELLPSAEPAKPAVSEGVRPGGVIIREFREIMIR